MANSNSKKNNLPQNVGIIMDGNGRWAINQDQPRALGHKAGAKTAKKIINEWEQFTLSYQILTKALQEALSMIFRSVNI